MALDTMSAIEKQYTVRTVRKRTGHATGVIDAPPARVFGAIVAVAAPADLTEGAEWVVARKVLGKRFESRAHVIELDRAERRFVYRSRLAGDNPSFSVWTWEVDPADGGSRVTLTWELRPVTFVRKRLISLLRNRWIARTEAPARLAAVARAVA